MKRFKDFAKEDPTILSFDQETVRDKLRRARETPLILSFPGHGEIRHLGKSKRHVSESFDDFKIPDYTTSDDADKTYDRDFHDPIRPKKLTKEHEKALWDYTSGSKRAGTSININNLHRNMEGDKTVGVRHATVEEVHEASKRLKSVFIPGNTNDIPITVHCGLPTHIGKRLKDACDDYDKGKFQKGVVNEAGVKAKILVPGYQSTSSKPSVARNFAGMYNMTSKSQDRHMMKMECPPGVGVSVVNHSTFDDENEVLLHHGLPMIHRGYTRVENHLGGYDYTHDIKVLPIEEAKPLEKYGKYDHPKDSK